MLLAFQICCLLLFFLFLLFLLYSILEKEKRAIKKTIPGLILFIAVFILSEMLLVPKFFQAASVLCFCVGVVLVLLKFGNRHIEYTLPTEKFDERDIMFSRMELKSGSSRFNEYYIKNPEKKSKDDLFRKEPGLLASDSKCYNKWQFNAASATFSAVEMLHPLVEGKANSGAKEEWDVKAISNYLKKWAIKLGALDVGFTLLKPHHLYSCSGRGENYGKPIKINHKYAIAFTVEMNHKTVSYTPKGPIIMESAQQYLNAGTIAVQLAQFIRNLGFDARAHIDANYKLICPIVAQDAGLGTIGRMGLLMTPKQGPRVRIGVVTTNLELTKNKKTTDSSVIQFCNLCKKCAQNCPSASIPESETGKNGTWKRWTINQESCFTYWTKVGTDCGRCITVCPYSHPNNFIHNLIRWMIKRNPVNRWLALKLDDFFYGRKPALKHLDEWMLPKLSPKV